LHDDDGVHPYEDQYAAFCAGKNYNSRPSQRLLTVSVAAMGVAPALNQTFKFDVVNQTYALAVEDIILKALQDKGFGDFWWIDWQQGGKEGGCKVVKSCEPFSGLNAQSTFGFKGGKVKCFAFVPISQHSTQTTRSSCEACR
jgi:hypothetical protein